MDRFGAYLLHFMAILFGFALAALAASAAFHLLLTPQLGLSDTELRPLRGALGISIPVVALFIAYLAFLPAMIAIGIAEVFTLRGWLYHALAGGAVALVVAILHNLSAAEQVLEAGVETGIITDDLTRPSAIAMIVGAGMFGGLAYWLIVGRTSGGWGPRRPAAGQRLPD